MDDYSLYGARLYNAKPEDAKRCSDAYERDTFKRAQDYGRAWSPTRQLVEMYEHSNRNRCNELRRSIRNLTYAVSCEAGAIVALLVRILLL